MKKDTSRETMLVISMGFLVMHIAFKWPWALYASLIAGLTGVLSAAISSKAEWLWMKLAGVLGKIVPVLLLTIIFYLLLFPLSLLSKLFNKDPLRLSDKYSTYFTEVDKIQTKKSMEKGW